MKRTLTSFLLLIVTYQGFSQSVISGVVNSYSPVNGINCDGTQLSVGSTGGFFANDLVLIIQMKGSSVSLQNDDTFGDVLQNDNIGNYEFNRVATISPGKIGLQFKISREYSTNGNIQIVKVPEYDDATAMEVTCKAWDGTTGGVMAIMVSGTLTIAGNLDVSGKGFRGGIAHDANTSVYHQTDYFYSFNNPELAGPKGEGIAIIPNTHSYGRGKAANGGGGGNAHNAGGGGGGNGGSGGNGGMEYYNTPGAPTPNTNGIGGLRQLEQDPTKIIMGGGGGAGHVNDLKGISGGNGGGIIFLKATNIVVNDSINRILANGIDVVSPGDQRNDGQGGGGGGGTVHVSANQITGNLVVESKGGFGGNCFFYVLSQIIGPGGGGGGGKILTNQPFPNLTAVVSGGLNGIANQNLSNNAQPGQKGVTITNADFWFSSQGPTATEVEITLCPEETTQIEGMLYTAPDTVSITYNTPLGCDSLVIYYLTLNTDPVECFSCAGSFLKIIGDADFQYRGHGVYDALDGNLYITGTKGDSALILKITPSGQLLWTRTFDVIPGEIDNIAEIIIDSDGMIAGCGQSGDFQPISHSFVFRYDPLNDQMLWLRQSSGTSAYVLGLVEKSPGGNYIINSNPHSPVNNARLLEISRATGLEDPGGSMSQTLDFGSADNFNSVLVKDGKLYGVGRFTNGIDFNDMRHTLARFDLNSGNLDYIEMRHIPASNSARLYGMDMVLLDNKLTSVGFGNETGDDLHNSNIFVYQTFPDGFGGPTYRVDLQATTSDAVDEIVRVPDGYILLCHSLYDAPGDLFLTKIDESGMVVWAKRVDYGNEKLFPVSIVQSQLLVKGDYLFVVTTTVDNQGLDKILVLKIGLDGKMGEACPYVFNTPVTSELIPQTFGFSINPQRLDADEPYELLASEAQPASPECLQVCGSSPSDSDVDITLCPGTSVTLQGNTYSQTGTVSLVWTDSNGCDSLVIYHIQVLPQPVRKVIYEFCPGDVIVIDGQTYGESGTVIDTLPGNNACDTIVIYTLIRLPQPTREETIEFCPGDDVVIGGQVYTQAGVVLDTLAGLTGCDTIVTYHLVSLTPAPSTVTIQCPINISIIAEAGTAPVVVDYALPTTATDCPCPGIQLELTAGLPPGGAFPNGTMQVCYTAKDSCGNSASCCFAVTIRELQPCDVKVNGCMRYEILGITADDAENQTYNIRVINNCNNKLIYTAIQLPDAQIAMDPASFSVYTAPSGREYEVRNPNFSPFYSIRFKSINDSIANGQMDIFSYTLPAQSKPLYIDITSRLAYQVFYEAHLNTFNCPVQMNRPAERGGADDDIPALSVYPNPSGGWIEVTASGMPEGGRQWRIFNSLGQKVQQSDWAPGLNTFRIELLPGLTSGLYFLEAFASDGNRMSVPFVLER